MYCLNSLPFGVASAPWLWTLVSKEPVKVSRARGIALVHHMDDIPSAAQSTEKAKSDFAFMIRFFRACGFQPDLEARVRGLGHPSSPVHGSWPRD